jgi:ribonuclease P protein component
VPRTYSLTATKDFNELFQKGRRLSSKNFSIVYKPAPRLKFAYIIAKKNVKFATHRNYSRRVIKEILKKEILPNIKSPFYIALMCRSDLKEYMKTGEFESIKTELINLFKPFYA